MSEGLEQVVRSEILSQEEMLDLLGSLEDVYRQQITIGEGVFIVEGKEVPATREVEVDGTRLPMATFLKAILDN